MHRIVGLRPFFEHFFPGVDIDHCRGRHRIVPLALPQKRQAIERYIAAKGSQKNAAGRQVEAIAYHAGIGPYLPEGLPENGFSKEIIQEIAGIENQRYNRRRKRHFLDR